jgi:cobalt/nickel transport system permease protein
MHAHEHRHDDGVVHAHAHHHARDLDAALSSHAHVHATSFEALATIISPLSTLDARAKILSGLALVVAIVTSRPLAAAEFALVLALFAALAALGRLPLVRVLARSALVLPFAGTIALLSPLQASAGSLNAGGLFGPEAVVGWLAAYAILTKAWLSTLTVVLVSATTPVPEFLAALRRLRVPDVLVMLLAFIYRYASVLGRQLHALRVSVASRAPALRGIGLVRLYGNLGGAMVVRAYERGERVHAAMLARGFDGTLPTDRHTTFGAPEALLITCSLMTAAAIWLY